MVLSVFGLDRRKTAVLQNAFGVTETKTLNGVYELSFSLPSADEKNRFCAPFHFARYGEDGELYRIVGVRTDEAETGTVSYQCEHVVATLADTVWFGAHTLGGTEVHTAEVIETLLDLQPSRNWVLGRCALDLEFEYGWEQENLLNALFSVPRDVVSEYRWSYDTTVFPWVLNLDLIDSGGHPDFYVRAERNLLRAASEASHLEVANRIYALGFGEGVNQLGIRGAVDADGSVWQEDYVEDTESIARFGLHEKVLTDRQFESGESLLAFAKKCLKELAVPQFRRSFDVADLFPLSGAAIDRAEVGAVTRLTMDGSTAFVTKTTRRLDTPGDLQLELSTRPGSAVDVIADLADRQRIESVYAQGATQLYQHSKNENASSTVGMVLNLYFPKEMRQINKVMLKVEMSAFRYYAKETSSGGGSTQTSAAGGGSSGTSAAGGTAVSLTIDRQNFSGWGDVNTSSKTLSSPYEYTTYADGSGGSHRHQVGGASMGGHTHGIPVASLGHGHTFSLSGGGSHSHTVNFPSHSHSVTVPNHKHELSLGVFKASGVTASGFDVYVGGTLKTSVRAQSAELDLVPYLLNSSGVVPRDSWRRVEIRPSDGLAYINASVFVQGFVNSRGGGNY